MSERHRPVIHDGQGDAMPCQCPACLSPFIPRRRVNIPTGNYVPPATIKAPARDHLGEARAC
jgi:hypothetical protein